MAPPPRSKRPLPLSNLSIKTKLLLMMLSLLVMSMSALFVIHLRRQYRLIAQVRDYTEELSTAIEIAQEQPVVPTPAPGASPSPGTAALAHPEPDPKAILDAYADKLRRLGVKDVSVAGLEQEVQASTNPQNVGKKLEKVVRKKKGHQEVIIRGVLGEESGPPGTARTTNLTIPIVVGDKRVGYLVITRILDDFSALSEANLKRQLLVTLGVFALGILLSLYLSWSFSRPLQGLTAAARQVARGDLSVQVPTGGTDEIGSLATTFNDMVEKLRLNRALEERLHFAERSTAIGRLASAVAHEIRNPLNFINLSIDHMRERLAPADPPRSEEFERILRNVKSEISRLNRLVNDFLSFGKPMRLDPRPCAIDQLVRDVASLVDHKAKDMGIALVLDVEESVPPTVADPELLKTCFLNVMINAVDAMPQGGVLSVAVYRVQERDDGFVLVRLTDTGRGMTPEDVKTAFEPYFSTKEAGVGLGLALTRKIVEDHGGRIELESAPGKGTTARILLPLVEQPAVALRRPELVS